MAATAPPAGPSRPLSAWAPLAVPVFRALWIAQFVSNVGTWMQTVGAQWLLIGHGATLVSLVQTASSLPSCCWRCPPACSRTGSTAGGC